MITWSYFTEGSNYPASELVTAAQCDVYSFTQRMCVIRFTCLQKAVSIREECYTACKI